MCANCDVQVPERSCFAAIGEPWRDGSSEAVIEHDHGWRLCICAVRDGDEVRVSIPIECCPKCGRKL
jgi:hypothetical protein